MELMVTVIKRSLPCCAIHWSCC